jgi:2'-5' RNA ligase
MATTYCSAIVILPPPELWGSIQEIRQEYDRQFRRWMPHINLIYPFRPRGQFDVLIRPLTAACRSVQPFEVELTEFHSFVRPHDCVMWLRPDPVEKVIQLHDAIFEVVPDCDHVRGFEEGFTPHLSVGQIIKNKHLEGTLRRLKKIWKPIKFTVSEVALLWRDNPPNDIFEIEQTIRLGE